MILEMKVPSPGESITEVEIATWLVEDGDYVEKDQPIAEVDSDKATLELPAEESGIITLQAEEGDAVEVGAVVCLIDTAGYWDSDNYLESKGIERTKRQIELADIIVFMDENSPEFVFKGLNLNINAENALERTNKKFVKRFQYLESKAKSLGKELSDMTLKEMDIYWEQAKKL